VQTYTEIPWPPLVFEYKAPGVTQVPEIPAFPTPQVAALLAVGLVLKRENAPDDVSTDSPSTYIPASDVGIEQLLAQPMDVTAVSSRTLVVPATSL
jgi:hypothetical protein